MKKTIVTTIDNGGRIVIPKTIRQQAGLERGTPVDVRFRDGRIEIEPRPRQVRISRRGRLAVAVPADPSEALTAELVRRTQRAVRSRNGQN